MLSNRLCSLFNAQTLFKFSLKLKLNYEAQCDFRHKQFQH